MPPSYPPTRQEIWRIARRTVDIIESNISQNVYLFGSAASTLWSCTDRVPNDIDIVVSKKGLDPEYIKRTIEREDDRYYLMPSKTPGAKHQILYCRLPGWTSNQTRRVKVDILVPPSRLKIPAINKSERHFFKNIPVMPIFELLIMKTQGWRDNRDSNRAAHRAKELDGISDIITLLKRARYEKVSYLDEVDKSRRPDEFMSRACTLVNTFVRAHGNKWRWRAIGFDV